MGKNSVEFGLFLVRNLSKTRLWRRDIRVCFRLAPRCLAKIKYLSVASRQQKHELELKLATVEKTPNWAEATGPPRTLLGGLPGKPLLSANWRMGTCCQDHKESWGGRLKPCPPLQGSLGWLPAVALDAPHCAGAWHRQGTQGCGILEGHLRLTDKLVAHTGVCHTLHSRPRPCCPDLVKDRPGERAGGFWAGGFVCQLQAGTRAERERDLRSNASVGWWKENTAHCPKPCCRACVFSLNNFRAASGFLQERTGAPHTGRAECCGCAYSWIQCNGDEHLFICHPKPSSTITNRIWGLAGVSAGAFLAPDEIYLPRATGLGWTLQAWWTCSKTMTLYAVEWLIWGISFLKGQWILCKTRWCPLSMAHCMVLSWFKMSW